MENGKGNILVIGKSGAGKSTLINAVLGDSVPEYKKAKTSEASSVCVGK